MIDIAIRNQFNAIVSARRELEKAVRVARETLVELESQLEALNSSFK